MLILSIISLNSSTQLSNKNNFKEAFMKINTNIPFFSLIIPTLNEEKCLPRLLNDLKKQTYKNFEIILVDGKSKDKTLEKAKHFKKRFKNFSILISDRKGVSHQRNLGSKEAKAEWIVFSDSDNRLPKYFLKEIRNYVLTNKVDLLSCLILPDTKSLKYRILVAWMNFYIQFQQLLKNNRVNEALFCIKTDTFQDLGGFDESIQPGEGNDLLKRSKEKNYKYHLVKYPKYTFSLRRLRKDGLLVFALKYAYLETLGMINVNSLKKIGRNLYPMEGGKHYTNKPKQKTEN